mmetsp:Transcript_23768/g.37247  ORF Transcript_23768/g.37247 Transcript_23768/m.37247 type:complete len:101 (-) Transcript_23768:19-321(-)
MLLFEVFEARELERVPNACAGKPMSYALFSTTNSRDPGNKSGSSSTVGKKRQQDPLLLLQVKYLIMYDTISSKESNEGSADNSRLEEEDIEEEYISSNNK